MYQYPYGNAQQLNLDWILSKLQELESGSGGGADLEEVANTLVSASFDATIPYRKYDYAFYDGKLYRALNDTIGAFNPADWLEVTLGADIPVLTRLVNADSALITTLQNQLQNLGSDEVANESTVTGTTVSDALGNLNGAINRVTTPTQQRISGDNFRLIKRAGVVTLIAAAGYFKTQQDKSLEWCATSSGTYSRVVIDSDFRPQTNINFVCPGNNIRLTVNANGLVFSDVDITSGQGLRFYATWVTI